MSKMGKKNKDSKEAEAKKVKQQLAASDDKAQEAGLLLCLSFSGKRRITAISSARMILPGRSNQGRPHAWRR